MKRRDPEIETVALWLLLSIIGLGLFLASRIPTPPLFFDDRVGSAGEWFAGAAGALVLVWAVTEPRRHEHRDNIEEARRRLAAARSVILRDTKFSPATERPDAPFRLGGTIANYASTPIRRVFLLIEWKPHALDGLERHNRPTTDVGEFFVADAVAPAGAVALVDEHGRLDFVGADFRGGKNEDIASLRVRFLDVHGDEWVGGFGPDTHAADIAMESRSGFWTKSVRDRLPGLSGSP